MTISDDDSRSTADTGIAILRQREGGSHRTDVTGDVLIFAKEILLDHEK